MAASAILNLFQNPEPHRQQDSECLDVSPVLAHPSLYSFLPIQVSSISNNLSGGCCNKTFGNQRQFIFRPQELKVRSEIQKQITAILSICGYSLYISISRGPFI